MNRLPCGMNRRHDSSALISRGPVSNRIGLPDTVWLTTRSTRLPWKTGICVCRSAVSDPSARAMLAGVRGHWSVENNLHWQLDVSFREDECRVRAGHAAENLSRLRRLALNLLKRDKSVKIGINGKRLKAGWNDDYLLHVLQRITDDVVR